MPATTESSPGLHMHTTAARLASSRNNAQDETYIIRFSLLPGKEQEFLLLLQEVLDAMRHETTFVNAVLHRNPDAPGSYLLYETWRDRQDVLNVQVHRPYRQRFWDALPQLLATPRDIEVWQPVRGDFLLLASDNDNLA